MSTRTKRLGVTVVIVAMLALGVCGGAQKNGSPSGGNGAGSTQNIDSPSDPTIPYRGNGGGPTQCADGSASNSSGSGTCSHHGGEG